MATDNSDTEWYDDKPMYETSAQRHIVEAAQYGIHNLTPEQEEEVWGYVLEEQQRKEKLAQQENKLVL